MGEAQAPFWQVLVECLGRWKLPDRFPEPRGPRHRDWMPLPRYAFRAEMRRE
ncbi:MAG: hypothetical protein IT427_03060 [Pirellulales bacterium]|nr:hypothetical protein [Pirellulales bacterium]